MKCQGNLDILVEGKVRAGQLADPQDVLTVRRCGVYLGYLLLPGFFQQLPASSGVT